jgi:hypothetical protein
VFDIGGTAHEVVFCKWLGHKLTGAERLALPLPSVFPLHQWAKTYMGMPPLFGHAWYASDSYGIVDACKVLCWEPIVSIGLRPGKRAKKRARAANVLGGVGEPLFANNVHAWSFGGSNSPTGCGAM